MNAPKVSSNPIIMKALDNVGRYRNEAGGVADAALALYLAFQRVGD